MQSFALLPRIVRPAVAALIVSCLVQAAPSRQVTDKPTTKRAMALADLYTLSGAIRQFRIDCDRYPTTKEGLRALRMCEPGLEKKWRGPYLSKNAPADPWGHAYEYKGPGKKGHKGFTLISRGPGHGAAGIVVDGP
jgi:general secretion pathway protein G